jgi:hypothetical protein
MAFQQFPQKGGIPSGNTAARPTGAVIGDTFYNGQLGLLEIYDGTQWIPNSAPAGIPGVTATDVGTSRPYASGALNFSFIAGTNGGTPYGYAALATIGALNYTSGATTASSVTLSVGNPGTYSISGTAYNGFGTSPAAVPANVTVTTVPQAPTIGTTTLSGDIVTVNWTLGSNGGKNLTALEVIPYLNGTTAQTAIAAATTSSTSLTISNATIGSSFTYTVRATNANGVGLESSASNSVAIPVMVDYLVVAGGGGGGGQKSAYYATGGGGAGGLRCTVTATGGGGTLESALSLLKNTNYTVTVGAGGSTSSSGGLNGNNSVFSTITSTGGGGGGKPSDDVHTGAAGGSSGGGGASAQGSGSGAPVANQGFRGGSGNSAGNTGAGGGGGAGAAGQQGGSLPVDGLNPAGPGAAIGGYGGAGVATSITGSSVTYAGGGGGGAGYDGTNAGTAAGAGGSGGGGAGNFTTTGNGTAGTANTGGGGGGCIGLNGSTRVGGAGGSGIVILRYSDTLTITIGAGLTGTTSSASGGYKRTTLTAGTGNVSWA